MMNVKILADKINGCQIGYEISKEIELIAKKNNLVIVFGASGDLMEFEGAIYDELSACGGCTAYLNNKGLIETQCNNPECPYFNKLLEKATIIKAEWCVTEEYSWTFKTNIPHETFDVMKDDVKYCKGIVFSLSDVN